MNKKNEEILRWAPNSNEYYSGKLSRLIQFPRRYLIVVMVFIGHVLFYGMNTNLGMAVVAMTTPKITSTKNGTAQMEPDFNWTSVDRGMVLSSFAYGQFFIPIGGIVSGRIGGSTAYILGNMFIALVTFCVPFCLGLNFYLFVLCIALTGFFETLSYASEFQLWSRWAPPNERAKLISISSIGIYGGPVASFVASGWILHEWGWAMLFYVTATVTLIWTCIWFVVVKNDPDDDKWISEAEKMYIKKELNNEANDEIKLEYPWKDIFTCAPFWMDFLCKFMIGVGFTFTTMNLPQFIQDTNNIDITKIGYISGIPHVCAITALPITGYLFDYIRTNRLLSLTNVHKLFACIGLLAGAVAYLMAGLWQNFIVSIICISLFGFFDIFLILEVQVLALDMAPRYAAFINAVATIGFVIASIVTPIIVGFIVTSKSQLQWSICFCIFSMQYIVVALLCLKFTSGELQPWANYSGSAGKGSNEMNKVPKIKTIEGQK